MAAVTTLRATVAEWASIAGLVGVLIALVQLVRTRSTLKATQTAINRTERHLALNHLLFLLPQLQRLEGDLDVAVENDQRDTVIRQLVEWRRLASEIHGLVDGQPFSEPPRTDQLRQSVTSAAVTKRQLVGSSQRSLKATTESVRDDIAAACEYAGSLSARLRSYSGPEPS
jgi:hypothetical protein